MERGCNVHIIVRANDYATKNVVCIPLDGHVEKKKVFGGLSAYNYIGLVFKLC